MVLNDRVLEETDVFFPCELSRSKLFNNVDKCIIDEEFCCEKVLSILAFYMELLTKNDWLLNSLDSSPATF